MQSSKEAIDIFLDDVRTAITAGRCTFTPREKNMVTLAQLGILSSDACDIVYELTHADYVEGPSPDRDYPLDDDFWVFKQDTMGNLIYIKLKIRYLEDGALSIFSFHIDEM